MCSEVGIKPVFSLKCHLAVGIKPELRGALEKALGGRVLEQALLYATRPTFDMQSFVQLGH